MKESNVQALARIEASKLGATTFRNNVGATYDSKGNFIRYGVGGKGGSDTIGFVPVTITPDMVGREVAIFMAIEFKTETGRVRPEQQDFIDFIKSKGGVAGIARSPDDVKKILAQAK